MLTVIPIVWPDDQVATKTHAAVFAGQTVYAIQHDNTKLQFWAAYPEWSTAKHVADKLESNMSPTTLDGNFKIRPISVSNYER